MITRYPSFNLYRCDGCGRRLTDSGFSSDPVPDAERIARMTQKSRAWMPNDWPKAYEQHFCTACTPLFETDTAEMTQAQYDDFNDRLDAYREMAS